MEKVFALVDCNNFYASCEQIFYPSLAGKPVVVLSNNDGCVIARSEEAKAAGISMGVPVFTISNLIEKYKVHVFSTNYALYGDISQRIMNILAGMVPDLEIYSIDEAFLDLSGIAKNELTAYGRKIRDRIMKWTGIPVSLGIAPTKTFAKVANHLAKADKSYNGVANLLDRTEINELLAGIPVGEVWGIGEKTGEFFRKININNVRQLINADENRVREKLGIVAQRVILELRGQVCYPLHDNPETKKEICTSRSFGRPITTYPDLESSTTSYAAKVGAKLRKRNLLAGSLLVFIMTNKYAPGPQYVNYKIVKLPVPTNQTDELIRFTMIALKSLYKEGYQYKKSGIIVSDVIPDTATQAAIWENENKDKFRKLMKIIDKINSNAGLEKVKFAIQGSEEDWKMRQHNLSPRHTTRWEDILNVNIDKPTEES